MLSKIGLFIIAMVALIAVVFFIGPMVERATGIPSLVVILAISGLCLLIDRLRRAGAKVS